MKNKDIALALWFDPTYNYVEIYNDSEGIISTGLYSTKELFEELRYYKEEGFNIKEILEGIFRHRHILKSHFKREED